MVAPLHYGDVIMGAIASQITSLTIVYSTVYSDADQRKHQSSASLAFVWGIHRGPVNSPHKWPVTRKMFPFDDVIMGYPHPGSTRRVDPVRLIDWFCGNLETYHCTILKAHVFKPFKTSDEIILYSKPTNYSPHISLLDYRFCHEKNHQDMDN